MQEYGVKGVDINKLIDKKLKSVEKSHPELSESELRDLAHEEVVADSMQRMLTDTDVLSKIEKLKAQDRDLWQKLKDFLTNLQAKIKELYNDLPSQSREAAIVKQMGDAVDTLADMFAEALVDAGNVQESIETKKAENNAIKHSDRYGIDNYSEKEYNDFGWATYNEIWTANERNTIFSRFADYKHNRNKYPTTKYGEAVIYSFDHPSIIVYIKGSISNPKVTKIVRIEANIESNINIIKEEIIKNEFRQVLFPYEAITDYYGQESISIHRQQDYESFSEYVGRRKGENSRDIDTKGRELQNRRADTGSGEKRNTESKGLKLSEKNEHKYSFGGRNSKTANTSLLAKAEQMESEGAESEEIRQETGWFRGYDGGWRYEINDLESSLIENPKIYLHDDGQGPYFSGKLTDILNHKDLFKAYPQLKKIKVRICTLDYNASGAYMTDTNDILLNFELFNRNTKEYQDYYDKYFKDEIEEIEQTPEYKEYSKIVEDEELNLTNYEEWLKLSQSAVKKFFSSEIGRRYYELTCLDDGFEGERIELGWSKSARSTLMHELQHAIQVIEGFEDGANGDDKNYYNNAGEVESRDVQARLDYTSEQRKNIRPDIDRKNVVFTKGIRFSERNYSYEALISKPDMQVTTVNDKVTYKATSTIRKNIVNQAVKNAIAVGHANSNGNAVVHVKDIDTDVIVSKRSLMHGLDRRLNLSTPVMLKIGEVLSNSIRINELTPKQESASSSYVLIGYATSKTNNYIVRAVVNKYTNEVDSVDILYAVSTKKETAGKLPGSHIKNALPTVSTISISNLLDYVNRYFPDILPEDVLKHYGHTERPAGEIGESALFSERDTEYAKELEEVNAQITKENKKLKEDVSDLKELLKLQTQETHGKMMKKSSIDAVAKKIMREKCFLTD